MCGIVAAIGNLSVKEEKIFKDMLQMDVLRGKDSTGVIKINNKAEVSYVKALGAPQELMDMKKFDKIMLENNIALIGHNRAATVGKITKANAHPFETGHIIGVHNGTLRNKHSLPDASDFAVDSENMFHAISLNGLKDTVAKVDGAYAISYVDTKDKSINFLRNEERPMCFTSSIDGKVTFFASESWILRAALERNDYKHKEVFVLKTHTHVKIPYDNGIIKPWQVDKEMPFFVKKPVTVNQSPANSSYSNDYVRKCRAFLTGLIGKEVECTFSHAVYPYAGVKESYLLFKVRGTNHDSYNLRLYVDPLDVTSSQYKVYNKRFKVFVKKVTSSNGVVWGVIDKRKIFEANNVTEIRSVKKNQPEEEEGDAPFCIGYNGALLTKEKYEEATKGGCAWCSSPVDESVSGDLHFISSSEFICPDCKKEEEVQLYLN